MSEPVEYVREIERYLCLKNGGHLVRVVGPAFELVRGWAALGVPLRIALRGIDRCCARREAKGTQARRRPLRIEFCEADVLDAFDDWRRAVGVTASGPGDEVPERRSRKPSLVQHLERAMARLAHARGASAASTDYERRLDAVVRDLEAMIPQAARARGEVRAGLIARLGELDAALLASAIDRLEPAQAAALGRAAADDIAPFGSRLPEDVRARALESAYRRLVREAARLPTLTCD
jgi:hypothetical protein